jgi:hypothetical protein
MKVNLRAPIKRGDQAPPPNKQTQELKIKIKAKKLLAKLQSCESLTYIFHGELAHTCI